MILGQVLAEIPSPPQGVWYVGPVPIRAYAIAILIGGVFAYKILQRRYAARGGPVDKIPDIVVWAVVFGIVGARLYHVFTTPEPYFGENGELIRILYIWQGGLGIWGAIGLGAVGAWIGLRRAGLRMGPFADSLAPGLLVAQAIGRLGNYFNQELFGGPTDLPWGLSVDDAVAQAAGYPAGTLFHPTFLYELVWNLAGAAFIVWADRRFRLGHGRVFWLYVMVYTAGRSWIEMVRIDEAQLIMGLRLNVWTSIIVFAVATAAFIVVGRWHTGREASVWIPGHEPEEGEAKAAAANDGEAGDGAGESGDEGSVNKGVTRNRDTGNDDTASESPADA